MGSRDGFVEVASEEVERFAGSAETVVIDGPTPPRLRRQIMGREAKRCGNPRCDHRAKHCHHIEFRSHGGETSLENEVGVCEVCHALIHAGLLRVSGDANGTLSWSPAVSDQALGGKIAAEGAAADRLPVLRIVTGSEAGPTKESAIADSAERKVSTTPTARTACALDLAALAQGLTRLGVSAARSKQIIGSTVAALPHGEHTESNVLRRALAAI